MSDSKIQRIPQFDPQKALNDLRKDLRISRAPMVEGLHKQATGKHIPDAPLIESHGDLKKIYLESLPEGADKEAILKAIKERRDRIQKAREETDNPRRHQFRRDM